MQQKKITNCDRRETVSQTYKLIDVIPSSTSISITAKDLSKVQKITRYS